MHLGEKFYLTKSLSIIPCHLYKSSPQKLLRNVVTKYYYLYSETVVHLYLYTFVFAHYTCRHRQTHTQSHECASTLNLTKILSLYEYQNSCHVSLKNLHATFLSLPYIPQPHPIYPPISFLSTFFSAHLCVSSFCLSFVCMPLI